ncbi:hypothetical protein Tco_0729563 [Tanacetum coccineum]|uniref:Zinc finger, CCHC-type n=1 Tax=Tanacetum coccineum TaxID=301880 RepID=A0ABQ4YQ53_9ASTR
MPRKDSFKVLEGKRAIGFRTPIDMLGFFGWLDSIKQGMLELVKVKCIFLGHCKGIVGNKALEVRVQCRCCKEFSLRWNHMRIIHLSYREDSNKAAFVVAEANKIYAHESMTFNNTVAYEVISKWKAGLKDDMDARSYVYMLSNGCKKCSDNNDAEIWATKGLLVKAKGNILGLEIIRDQSSNTLRVLQSRIHNENLVHTSLNGHSTLSLEDSLSGDYDMEKNASTGVDMLDGFDHGLQINIQVFMDFDYAIGRSITFMSRSITGYGLMILRCAGSLKANLQHMVALSTTEAGHMAFTEAWKKEIWLKGLLTESGYELRLVAGIANGALVKELSSMAYPSSSMAVARRVVDEIIKCSGKMEVPKYMKFFMLQQIIEDHRFANILRDQAEMASICVHQLHIMITEMEAMPDRLEVYGSLLCLKESKEAENNKLAHLNDLIAQTEEVIRMKEGHMEVMEEAIRFS